ncbi:uncharacterized protein TRIADDRAFT_59237 [Trichoplax adhaerens]|uniref:Uncharacterized protein n=1 Tax=Trichoplax adhaerens TaxID=10228 RepID=B3S588_TRIAD|nr:hypothetical protein TRIADDRAFT_59237 [Trichoplax adhaerens]EDV22220.1 hypothetical protein TRIADDRAFT_59237 [Trichoplax adhaerens]|eukprot:XP_002115375.1 hypothetical protein TRIADDRAFT_59237 [Trichoplax adhaerens]
MRSIKSVVGGLVITAFAIPLMYAVIVLFGAQLTEPLSTIEAMVMFTSYGGILGAWLGAFTIPLDWDRPWQVWPIPCSIGTMMGYGAGLYIIAAKTQEAQIMIRT